MSCPSRSSVPPVVASAPSASARLVDKPFVRLLAIQVAIGFGFSLNFLLPKYLATDLHAQVSSIGALASVGLLASVLASPLMGSTIDRIGRRRSLQLSAIAIVLTSLGMVVVRQLGPLLYALRILTGIAFALGFNAAAAAVADRAPRERLSRAMGLLGVSSLATNAIAPALGEAMAHDFGWSSVFVVCAGSGVVTWLLSARHTDAPRVAREATDPAPTPSDPALWLAALFNGAAFGTLITFGQAYALEQGAVRVSGYYLGYTVGALVVRLAFGDAADRWGRRNVAKVSLFGYGLAVLSAAYLRPNWLELFGLGFGICHGFLYPALAALVAAGANAARRGRALTHFNAAFNCGNGLALFGCGWLAQARGYPYVFTLVGAATIVASLALIPRVRHSAYEVE
jgi:MFS family permease